MPTPDADPSATLAKAKQIADGLQFACRLPDRKPDFTACGGPAAEAYWEYFTPARIASLVAALEAVLKLADEAGPVARDYGGEPIWWSLTPAEIREAITRALNGDTDA